MTIYFVTTNSDKFSDLKSRMKETFGFQLEQIDFDLNEGRCFTVKETVEFKLAEAKRLFPDRPIVTDDRGLFIDSLKGFPGPYIKFALRTIGVDGIVRLMENLPANKRGAELVLGLGYFDGEKDHYFEDIEHGQIADIVSPENTNGWGDLLKIFVNPKFGSLTLGQMTETQWKNYLNEVEKTDCFTKLVSFLNLTDIKQ